METAADRCERKRQREKQRRSDLASAFDVLANILLQVEPGADTDNEGQHVRKRSLDDMNEADSAELAGQSNITRLDLIVETVEAIRRLHSENVKLKNALKVRAGQAAIDDALQVCSYCSNTWLNHCYHSNHTFFCGQLPTLFSSVSTIFLYCQIGSVGLSDRGDGCPEIVTTGTSGKWLFFDQWLHEHEQTHHSAVSGLDFVRAFNAAHDTRIGPCLLSHGFINLPFTTRCLELSKNGRHGVAAVPWSYVKL